MAKRVSRQFLRRFDGRRGWGPGHRAVANDRSGGTLWATGDPVPAVPSSSGGTYAVINHFRRETALRRPTALAGPPLQQGLGFLARGTGAARPAGPDAAAGPHHRGAGRCRTGASAVEVRRTGKVHRAGRPPGPQRNPLLPTPGREPRGAAAHRLHAHRGPRLPAVQPHLPPPARPLDHPGRRGPRSGPPPQCPFAGHLPDRGHRQ